MPLRRLQQSRRSLPAFALALLVCAGILATPDDSEAAFKKTLPLNPGQLDDSQLGRALDLARSAGVRQIQAPATWWYMTRWGQGTYDWTDIDRLLAGAEARGMDVVLQLHGTPDWVHPDLQASVHDWAERIWYPPVRNDVELTQWAAFVWNVVDRYRGRISQYEIWNEPNLPEFWKPEPRVEDFARLMRSAYYAARQVDPSARVVMGGLSFNDLGYLRAYYDTLDALWPEEARGQSYFFDVLGAHPYSANRSPRVDHPSHSNMGAYGRIDRNFVGFRRLKQIVDSRDVIKKPVYIGEYGFSTVDTWMPGVPDRLRARYLRHAYNLAAAQKYVTGMAWYGFVPNTTTGPEWTIVNSNLEPSRTFKALRKVPSRKVPKLIDASGRG